MIIASNQQGFLEAPGLVLLVLLSSLIGVKALLWQKKIRDFKQHHQQVLCLKESMLLTQKLVKRINQINQLLRTAQVGQVIGLGLPGIGVLAGMKWEKVKKILQQLQEGIWWSTQKEFLRLRAQGCSLPLEVMRTPYPHRLKLMRAQDLAQPRTSDLFWHFTTPIIKYRLRLHRLNSFTTTIHWDIL
jgi:hypothetical protein